MQNRDKTATQSGFTPFSSQALSIFSAMTFGSPVQTKIVTSARQYHGFIESLKQNSRVKARWSVEVYHWELKQTRGIQRCQARTGRSQRNQICPAIMARLNKYKSALVKTGEGMTERGVVFCN